MKKLLQIILLASATLFSQQYLKAQRPFGGGRLGNLSNLGSRFGGAFSGASSTGGSLDSLQHRDPLEDSITIRFRLLDDTRSFTFDSSVNDFYNRFSIPYNHVFLGNHGNATRPIIFTPQYKTGWDAGFHAFDVYTYKPDEARFFTTTRPYSLLNYLIGSKAEQMITIHHTQNIKPNWNFSIQYRLINSPGFFSKQNANHNNYQFTSWYNSKNRRYTVYFLLVSNKLTSSENGGIVNDSLLKEDVYRRDRITVPTKLGGQPDISRNFFSTSVSTGNKYNSFTVLYRHQYDLGKKDSIVTDSIVIPLFYPKLRFEHTLSYSNYRYRFVDASADSLYYAANYGINGKPVSFVIDTSDKWKELINDFSIIQFPELKNLQHFFKVGASLQNLNADFGTETKKYYNIFLHGEYRNKSRNKKWDIELNGKFYANGLNAGDYAVNTFLRRLIGKKLGYLELGFHNINRTPSYLFNGLSNFNLGTPISNVNKENITNIFAGYELPQYKMRISGNYYLIGNYTYFTENYKTNQEGTLFNVLQIRLEKEVRFRKYWHWYIDLVLQQTDGTAPVNVPFIFTRNRFSYEGIFFKNLNLATGIELRYHTAYKADNYSPYNGQFYYQNKETIRYKAPDFTAFLNFRIRSFTSFIRLENLNTVQFTPSFGFTNHNFAATNYPYPGLLLRLGIWWTFVN
ncbi:MAG TPA: putative porin [Chitinophagaceae bacterium]|nr:putative porin [Chitinophagaceae bacterium]